MQRQIGLNPYLAQLLVQRGIDSLDKAQDFFRPKLTLLHDPFLMKDMEIAVSRIEQAIEKDQRIMIYGDYDVDGTTAVALLYSFLRKHYPNLITYIPDRYREGYGISREGIDTAQKEGVALIIALDCGIKALEIARYAREKAIDLIICDHHLPGAELPEATAILNPKQETCSYPYDELSGCGVGFKLVQALCQKWERPDKEWKVLLDLLAISIGADIVPIRGENRILAHYGLRLLNEKPRYGLAYLKELAGKKGKSMTITDVVFLLGPRINAAGRIAHGKLAVELLSHPDAQVITESAQAVNEHNSSRKELDKQITQEALQMIVDQKAENRKTTVVYDPEWHKGVIGIVASRLTENYYRPTIVFTRSGDVLAGSARSVKGFDIYQALEDCGDVLEQFGGHMYAAGMTLREDRLEEFRERFEKAVSGRITPGQLIPRIALDLELPLSALDTRFYRILKQMEPFGPKNLPPVLASHHLGDAGCRVVGQDQRHLRVVLREPSSGKVMNGIGFGMADKMAQIEKGRELSVAYHLEENEYQGQRSLQMRILDIKPTEMALQDAELGDAAEAT